jgi:hypothetical protein
MWPITVRRLRPDHQLASRIEAGPNRFEIAAEQLMKGVG